MLAIGSLSPTNALAVSLWDVASGQHKATVGRDQSGFGRAEDEGWVTVLTFSPDGKTLATGSASHAEKSGVFYQADLWDVASGQRKSAFLGVYHLAFSPDGKTVATVGGKIGDWTIEATTVRLWPVDIGGPDIRMRMPVHIVKPPAPLPIEGPTPIVFLAGDWQAQLERSLADLDVLILNPLPDAWDASGVLPFREQVEWELAGLERASVVAMYFASDTKAPVTLLELGLCAHDGRLVVCCPPGYWRRGHVEVVCRRYGLSLLGSLTELVAEVRRRLGAEP
jgi:hypothetical protein